MQAGNNWGNCDEADREGGGASALGCGPQVPFGVFPFWTLNLPYSRSDQKLSFSHRFQIKCLVLGKLSSLRWHFHSWTCGQNSTVPFQPLQVSCFFWVDIWGMIVSFGKSWCICNIWHLACTTALDAWGRRGQSAVLWLELLWAKSVTCTWLLSHPAG